MSEVEERMKENHPIYVYRGEIFNRGGTQTIDPSPDDVYRYLGREGDSVAQTEELRRQQ